MAKKKAYPEKPAAKADNKDSAETQKRLREYSAEFLADWRADEPFRKLAREANDFYDGNQLSAEEREVLEERGQPPVTINRIKPKIDAIGGMQQAMRVDTRAYPAGQREQETQAVSEFFRTVEDDNDFDDTESLAFEDIMVPGRSWYEIGKRWEGLKSRHYVRRAFLEDVTPDRRSRLVDLSDARHIHQSVWMDLEVAIEMFPKAEAELRLAANEKALDSEGGESRRNKPDQYAADTGAALTREDLNEFADSKNQRVRIIKKLYRELTPRRYYFHAELPEPVDVTDMDAKSLETLKAAHPRGHFVTQIEKKLHSCTFTWNAELEVIKDIRPYDKEAKFNLIMVEGYRERNTGIHYGLVRQMLDPQREVNKRRSKSLHMVSVNRVIFEEGAFQNEQQAKEESSKPDAWIRLQPNAFQKIRIENNLDMSMAHFQLLQQATQEIDAAGVSRELEGRSGASSGRDFQLRQQQAVQGIRKLISNLRSARRRVALYLLDEWLNEHPEVKLTKQDVVVEEAPDTLNLQQETFDKLAGLAEKGIVPPNFFDLLIEVSSLDPAMKKKFLERIQAMQAAQAQALAAAQGAAPQGAAPGNVQ